MRPRNEELRTKVRELRQGGMTLDAIAAQVGRSKTRVSQLLAGEPKIPRAVSRFKTRKRSTEEYQAAARRTADRRWESEETDIRLDLVLGAPEDLRDYQDCIAATRAGLRKA